MLIAGIALSGVGSGKSAGDLGPNMVLHLAGTAVTDNNMLIWGCVGGDSLPAMDMRQSNGSRSLARIDYNSLNRLSGVVAAQSTGGHQCSCKLLSIRSGVLRAVSQIC